MKAVSQYPIPVTYDNQCAGSFIADILVENAVVLELKSVSKITTAHEVQLVNYLTATGISVGLIINFGDRGVEIKRKVRQLPH